MGQIRYGVSIKGVGRGLLMHKFSIAAQADMENQVKKSRAKPTPQEDAENSAYRLASGGTDAPLVILAEHLLGAITTAGSGLQVKGKGKATYKKVFNGGLDIEPAEITITRDGEGVVNYTIDSRPVVIKATKGRVVRHRPHIPAGWEASFEIIAEDSIPEDVLNAAVQDAGRNHGIMDFRPRFGQFIVTVFKVAG